VNQNKGIQKMAMCVSCLSWVSCVFFQIFYFLKRDTMVRLPSGRAFRTSPSTSLPSGLSSTPRSLRLEESLRVEDRINGSAMLTINIKRLLHCPYGLSRLRWFDFVYPERGWRAHHPEPVLRLCSAPWVYRRVEGRDFQLAMTVHFTMVSEQGSDTSAKSPLLYTLALSLSPLKLWRFCSLRWVESILSSTLMYWGMHDLQLGILVDKLRNACIFVVVERSEIKLTTFVLHLN